VGFKEEKMMKSVSVCKVILVKRALRINRQEMMADLDMLMLLDKPSKLTDKRIP